MRALMVVSDFLPHKISGIEQYVFELSSALMQQGHNISVLFSRPVHEKTMPLAPFHDVYQGLPTIQIPVPANELDRPNNPRVRHMLRQVLRQERPDVMHIHNLQNLSFAVLDAAYQAAVPTMYTAHDFSFFCSNFILQDAYGMVCSGPENLEKCVRCVQTTRRRLLQLPPLQEPVRDLRRRALLSKKHFSLLSHVQYPSDFSRSRHHAFGLRADNEIRADLGMRLPRTPPAKRRSRTVRFTYLGGICHIKGLDIAVNAFNMADTRHAILQLYGSVNNPIYFTGIKSLIRPEKRVTYYGRFTKSNLRLIFSQTDVLVLPSRMETFSFVAREALAHGVPVVAARAGALPEVVIHGHNGLLFDPSRPGELADIFTLLSQDPNLVHALRSGIGPVRSIENDARDTAETYATVAASEKAIRYQRQEASSALRQQKN